MIQFSLIHCPLADEKNLLFQIINFVSISCAFLWNCTGMDASNLNSTLIQLMLSAVRQQAITCTNVKPDICCYMASLGHNELNGSHTAQWSKTPTHGEALINRD